MVSTAPTGSPIFSSNAIILEPTRSDGTDVLFFFLPGASTAAEAYLPLLKEVQSKCCVRLWVAILDPAPLPVVITSMIEASFPRVLERVEQMGFPGGSYVSEGVVFGGHSFGAVRSRSVALKEAEAFIQLGSFLDFTRDNLVQYPKPVLTLSGALDGQVTNGAIAKHAGDVYDKKDELGDFFVYGVKPVILVPGMNHAQFSHGMPDIERGDFDAEISIEEARDVSSALISSFIALHMSKSAGKAVSASLTFLKEAVSQTHAQYKAFWEGMAEPGRNAATMQLALASLPATVITESNIGVVQHDYEHNFIYSKPSIDLTGRRRVIINTFLFPVGKFNLLSDFLLKCKSGEAVAAAFDGGDRTQVQETRSTGAEFNKRTFAEALEKVPEAVRKKYEERGKKLRFVEDLGMMKGEDWVESALTLKPADDGTGFVDVQSPVLISPLEGQGVPDRFAGMHYFKLLTAGRALSWVYEDCFRP